MDQASNSIARGGRRSLRGAWGLLLQALWVLAILAVTYLIVAVLLAAKDLTGKLEGSALSLGIAAIVYLASHGLRILRLAILIGGWRVGLRSIASFHLMTAAVTLATPLKLGEIYRVLELSHLVGGFLRALVITWWERLFDAMALLLMLGIALSTTGGEEFRGVIILLVMFIVITAVVVFVAPDNLRRLAVLIIRRYRDPRTVPLLAALDMTRRAILEAPRLARHKVSTLFALTVLIWAANLLAFVIALPAIKRSFASATTATLVFLTSVTEGQTLVGALASPDPQMVFIALSQAPLVALGLMAGLYYGQLRRRQGTLASTSKA